MNSRLSPRNVPYQSRSHQIAEYLKKLIRSGYWPERLPSERALAQEINVSRDTIRAALALLQTEGIVIERSRTGTRTRKSATRKPSTPITVGLLLPMKIEYTTYRTLAWVNELQRLLYQKQITVQIYDDYFHRPRIFQQVVSENHHDCLILFYPNEKILQWSKENQLQAVVVGSIKEPPTFPSVNIHFRALVRHAIGRILQLGHKNLVFILHRRERGEDAESISGFQEAVATSSQPHIHASIEYHNGTPEGLCKLADRLLERDIRPTAWIVAVAPHFQTILMHLLKRGISIPEEISLISQDSEPWQHFSTPEPTRYVTNVTTLAKSTVRQILDIIAEKRLSLTPTRIIPDLIQGKTLGPAPDSSTTKP